MSIKIQSAIEKINVNAATFNNVLIEPTLVNFFYGNNGTGKSTIARVIDPNDTETGRPTDLIWKQGKSADDYSILIYNQEFIAANFKDYGKLKGVFSVGEQNIKIQADITEKNAQRIEHEKSHYENSIEKIRKESARAKLIDNFQNTCWDYSKTFRVAFEASITGYKTKAKFIDKVMYTANPARHDIGELKMQYEIAFDPNAAIHNEFKQTGGTKKLKGSPGNGLLGKSIISSIETPFADFMKAINATDWVRQGQERFFETPESKCPYCQRKLPDDFQNQIAACFDGQYQEDINSLRKFQSDYADDMQGFLDILKSNMQGAFPKLDLTEYKAKLELLEKTIDGNKRLIANKLKEPSSIVKLENVITLRDDINAIIEGFNKRIRANNEIIRAKKVKQTECNTKVWEHIAFTLQKNIAAFKIKRKNLDDEINVLQKLIDGGGKASRVLEEEIAELNKKIVSTAPTIKSINDLLCESGFQGFNLREKPDQQNVYEVVRKDGQVAAGLSESERNFIAFLYFYHLVRGSHTDGDFNKEKIVVIDDPVSGMDSNVLFIVSILVRELVGVCLNNVFDRGQEQMISGDYIKQMFILTHNVNFHNEITYNQTSRYQCVSFFVLSKSKNKSSVKHCVRQSQNIPAELENFNPVQYLNSNLWSESNNPGGLHSVRLCDKF